MAKDLIYGSDARAKMFSGVEKVAKAVAVTLGPCGKYVVMERHDREPLVTKDGVTVAKEIELTDPVENVGAALTKAIASKTNEVAGDNTTTSTVLGYAIAKEGLKALNSGMNPVEVKKGIETAISDIADEIVKMGTKVTSTDEIKSVATISANNDEEIGGLLSTAIEKIGKDGVITTEDSNTSKSSVKVIDGFQFDNGEKVNQYFFTNKERMETEFKDAYIFITDKKITSMNDIMKVVQACARDSKPIVFVCDEMGGEALSTVLLNVVRGTLKAAYIKAPSYGDNKRNLLQDMAIFTGGMYLADEFGTTLSEVDTDQLGRADVKITKDCTTFTNGKTKKEDVEKRVNEIKTLLENTTDERDKDKLKGRLSKLTDGVAVISVGGATEVEVKEKKFRIEDTIAATRAALEEGIIPGGGVTLYNISRKLKPTDKLTLDETRGYTLVLDAIKEPLKQIAENSGVNGEVVINNLSDSPDGFGYNAKTKKYEDMMKAGVIDTVKAMKSALVNAGSISSFLLTSECVITDIPDENDKGQLIAQPMMM